MTNQLHLFGIPDEEQCEETLPEKKRRQRPDVREKMSLHTEPGDNAKYILHNMAVSSLADNPVDMSSEEQVVQRINDYFSLCVRDDMKPSVASLALAFGVHRMTLWRWIDGQQHRIIPENVRLQLERAHSILNSMIEDYMLNGKINPVSGIFLMKNNFGYEDKREISVGPSNSLGDQTPSEDLRRKYLDAIETNYTDKSLPPDPGAGSADTVNEDP